MKNVSRFVAALLSAALLVACGDGDLSSTSASIGQAPFAKRSAATATFHAEAGRNLYVVDFASSKVTIYAPGSYAGYAAEVMPGVSEALDRRDAAALHREEESLAAALRRAAARLDDIARIASGT